MFLPPRYVVVDDNPNHLGAILLAFQRIGAPCLGLTYKPDEDLDSTHFKGVRVLILDLHLNDQTTTSEKQRFAHIAQILEDNISRDGGPFVLVIWTEHARETDRLIAYMNDTDSLESYARPLAIAGLAKSRFIDLDTGDCQQIEELRQAVVKTITEKPQLAALGSWEKDVAGAIDATLAALTELVPESSRNTDSYPQGVGDVLGRLARAAVGPSNVGADPRAAMAAALAPILADRIINQNGEDADSQQVWRRAIQASARGAVATPVQVGKINRMLHMAVPESESISATDWGAVVEYPYVLEDAELRRKLGVSKGELFGEEFKIGRTDRSKCRVRLVRIGAACDHAQGRRGPIPFLVGVEIPTDVARKKDNSGRLRVPGSEWSSPLLMTDTTESPFSLVVNGRYSLTVPRDDAEQWTAVYRLREQLLMHLVSHTNSYLSRPGVIQLDNESE